MVRSGARTLHPWLAWVFVGTVILQVFLAGMALFAGTGFRTHVDFGYTFPGLAALALLIATIVAGMPRREIGWAFLVLVLYIVQTILPTLRTSLPIVAALHPVNAVALFALGANIAVRSRKTMPRRVRDEETAAAPVRA